jgi:signal transduction histidine kinase
MLRQSERDLAAFAQFSESLTGFIQGKAKQKNEEEYQLGLAEVIDGSVAPTPAQADQYQASATLLQDAASADNQVSNQLSNQGQLAAGEQFKAQSQAISGWRSYGRAVGSAKQVATNAQSFFLTWMENSKDKVVPTEDGRMISPAEAKSPAEIQAALAVGQQTLIKQSNIRNINPVIIAEHLAPTIQAVKGQMFANKLSSEVRKAKETAVSDITGVVRSEFSNPDLGIDGMAESFQRNVKAFEIEGGLSRGAASDTVIQEALDSIATLPEEQATMMLEKLSQVRKIANDPKSLSLGSAYANMFGKALDTIEGRVEAEEAKNERKLGKQA